MGIGGVAVTASVEIFLLWVAFALTHMGLSSNAMRSKVVARTGEQAFMGLYSIVALAIFIPLVSIYFDNKHSGPLLWSIAGGPVLRWFMYIGMGFAFSLLVAGLVRPSPVSIAPGKSEVTGVLRVTRHPLFMAAGLYGVLHLLVVSVYLSDFAFFGGFPAFAIAGCHHQDQRKLQTLGDDFRDFHSKTAFFPGARGGLLAFVREQPIAIAVGIGVTVALRSFHGTLFGG
jgi:uncharacterized membrane protein